MTSAVPSSFLPLFDAGRVDGLDLDSDGIVRSPDMPSSTSSRRFEGMYGRLYNDVVQNDRLRSAASLMWNTSNVIGNLDPFLRRAIVSTRVDGPDAVLVDVPSGGGTLLPFLDRHDYVGRVIEADLALPMLRRAHERGKGLPPAVDTLFLQSDALDLPLADGVASAIVSLNGLHVLPDHDKFIRELARITRPGGSLWMTTIIDSTALRHRAIAGIAQRAGVLPQAPPTLTDLRNMLEAAGFEEPHLFGDRGIIGLHARLPRR